MIARLFATAAFAAMVCSTVPAGAAEPDKPAAGGALVQLAYTILYVPEVVKAVEFYERAFGLKRRFVHDSQQYAEMETGVTALAFSSEELGKSVGVGIRPSRASDAMTAGVEMVFVSGDAAAAYARAVAAGATAVAPPEKKPWGQTVAYVRDLNGFLVELATPIAPQ